MKIPHWTCIRNYGIGICANQASVLKGDMQQPRFFLIWDGLLKVRSTIEEIGVHENLEVIWVSWTSFLWYIAALIKHKKIMSELSIISGLALCVLT